MLTYLRVAAAVAVVICALPHSVEGQTEPASTVNEFAARLASIPVLAQVAAEPNLRSYSAPVNVQATIRKFFASFAVRRHGMARFESPNSLTISLDSVPSKYTEVFSELGDVQTWLAIYDLEPLDNGKPVDAQGANALSTFQVRGVPRHASDVDHILIKSTDSSSPIAATWYLRSGWTISAIIETEFVGQHLLPKHETADIVGHGLNIHTDLTFGDYALYE